MSRTIVPNYAKQGPAPIFESIKEHVQEHLDMLQDLFESIKGDEDKASSIDDANYYEGCAWGVEGNLRFLTGKSLMIDPDSGEDVVMPDRTDWSA